MMDDSPIKQTSEVLKTSEVFYSTNLNRGCVR
ncbi:MAG: hypothetical protein RIR73_683 [Chloroflexota bacterium]